MDLSRYLDRIDYKGTADPTPATLRSLHRAHMLAVPFENLDIVPLHREIHLDEPALWEKIVLHRRGGFCYELNGLFAWLLRQCGFDVTYLNGRVFTRAGKLGMDFDHLTLLVRAPGEAATWLADVGFGDCFLQPLVLQDGEQPQGPRSYRLEKNTAGYIVWQRDYDGTWERQYFFDLKPRSFPADYEAACAYHQRSPESHFTRASIISRVTETGRVSLEQDKLIVTQNGVREERPIVPAEWATMLQEHFGVVL